MGIILNGNKPSKIIYNGAEPSLYFNGSKIWPEEEPTPLDEVQIGNQIWKTKNLAIDDGQGGIYTQTVNYGQGNVVEYYYTWEAAVRVAATVDGWHLPSDTEWSTLISTIGGTSSAGTKLKSTYGWSSGNGTDDYGFAAFPAGYNNNEDVKNAVRFWTATQSSISNYAYSRYITTRARITTANDTMTNRYSIRLIKDAA